MNENELSEILAAAGLDNQHMTKRWTECAPLLAALDAIGRGGANAIVKMDGGRDDAKAYTVVVSGGPLGDQFFRQDGSDLRALLRDAISFYLAARATSAGDAS